MTKVLILSVAAFLFTVMPGQAQIVRRPLVRKFIQSPFVHQVVDFGIHQFLPGFPSLPSAGQDGSTILVDSSVRGNLARTTTNLSDAADIMKDLLERNKAVLGKKDEPKKDGKVDPKAEPSKVDASSSRITELATMLAKATDSKLKTEIQKTLLLELQKAAKIDVDTKLFQSHMEKGNQALLGEKFADAVAAFREALKLSPDDAHARQGLWDASSELRNADLNQAIKALTEQLKISKKEAPKLAEVKFKTITEVLDISKTGSSPVTVELADAAKQELSLKASAKNVDAKMLSGSGTIKKGEKTGVVTITTDNVPDTLAELTIDIAATPDTQAASMPIKIKVKSK